MKLRTHDAQAEHSGFERVNLGLLDLGVFSGTFLFRWLTVDFSNDHFVHLSRARQILLGDVPIRDFFDPGLFLQYYLSSAVQLVFGYNLFGEALLTISLIAFGTMLVFHLSARLSRSLWLAAGAALLTAVASPSLYNYPKVFLYVSAIGLAWRYAQRGSRLHVGLMAAVTALAFLMRHDHGVYIAFMVVCFLGLCEWGGAQFWRRLGLYAGITASLLLPFLVFVQTTAGLVSYVGGSRPQVGSIASSLSSRLIVPVPVKIDLSAPLWEVAPAGPVNVRWAEGVEDATRRDREVRYGLTAGVGLESRTWRYVLTNYEAGNVRALMEDGLVEDTAGIDREAARVPLKRSLVPGIFNEQNALAWFYYLTLLLPVVALVRVGADWRSGRVARPEAAIIAAAAILCCIISHTLVRDHPHVSLADVAAPTFVLAAWLARRRDDSVGPHVHARLKRAGIFTLFLVTFVSVWSYGRTTTLLARSGVLGGPAGVWEQVGAVNRRLHLRPIDDWAPQGSTGLRAVTRYVLDCTAPSDRILVTWFAPEVFYYAERGFAGGQVYLDGPWHASVADQRLTIDRMQQQSVPIILGRRDEQEVFQQDFPLIYDFVRSKYRLAAESTFRGEAPVFSDIRGRTTGLLTAEHPDLGLPCYQLTSRMPAPHSPDV